MVSSAGSPWPRQTAPQSVLLWMPNRVEGTSLSPGNGRTLCTDLIDLSLSKKVQLNFSFSGKEIGIISKRRKGKVGISEVLIF